MRLLLLEVAIRLDAPEKMRDALTTFKTNLKFNLQANPEPRAKFMAMRAALHVGEWAFAEQMLKDMNDASILAQLHAQASQTPTTPDYAAAMAWAVEAKSPAAPSKLLKAHYKIKRFRLREAASGSAWTTEEPVANGIFRSGALVHWLGSGPLALPYAGCMDANRLQMLGFWDEANGRHRESIELTDGGGGTWKGTLTTHSPQGAAIKREIEFDLEPSDS